MRNSAAGPLHAPILLQPSFAHDAESVEAAISTRHGGVSADPYRSLNLGFRGGDEPQHVLANRHRFAEAAGFELERSVLPILEHGARCVEVGAADEGRGAETPDPTLVADALFTKRRGVALMVTGADCYPVLIADRRGRVVGVAHAGWRGVLVGVVPRLVAAMRALEPELEAMAALGPGLCRSCCEVGEDVARQFEERRGEAAEGPSLAPWVDREGGAPHLDLMPMLRAQLSAAGAAPDDHRPACTRCHPEHFFSHRGTQGAPTGRLAAAIWITQ